jgi:hypothetical protein
MSVCFILIKEESDTFEMNPLIPEEKREIKEKFVLGSRERHYVLLLKT